jgi:DNA-binding beta-propeller fold protein YncE
MSWSGVAFAPAPGTFDLPNEQIYVVDAGDANAGPAVLALRADNGELLFRLEADTTAIGEPPEIAVSHGGKWLWVLEGAADADRLTVVDTRSGDKLATALVDHRLPMAAGSYWPPRILGGPSDNLVIQRAGRGRFPVWLENYLYTSVGVRRQVEPPFTYNGPVCGPAQLLLHTGARQLIAVCQPADEATRVQEIQLGRGPGGRRDVLTTALPVEQPGRAAVLSPDGGTLYVVSDGPIVTSLKLGSGAIAGPYDLTEQTRLAFGGIITASVPGIVLGQPIVSPDGSTLYLALRYPRDALGYNTLIGTLQAIDMQTWRVKARMGMERQMVDLAASADGDHLYALENSTQRIFVFDTRRHALVREFTLPAADPVRIHVGAAP